MKSTPLEKVDVPAEMLELARERSKWLLESHALYFAKYDLREMLATAYLQGAVDAAHVAARRRRR